jgi:hypothetical protein
VHPFNEPARQRLTDREGQTEIDAASRRPRQCLDLELRAVEFAQYRSYAIAKHQPGVGKIDPASVAVEKPHAEIAFKRPEMPAERRLCDVQTFRRSGNALEFAHLDEILKLSQIHRPVSPAALIRFADVFRLFRPKWAMIHTNFGMNGRQNQYWSSAKSSG